MPTWQRRKILIWGKTRPELSRSHKETVCTGGVFEDTKKFVRLYPIPLRYLDDEKVFKKYQWIEAEVCKAMKDTRIESYNIRCRDIKVLDTIPTKKGGDWSERAKWIMQPGVVFPSITALQHSREQHGTTIGMVKPEEITEIYAEPYPESEKKTFWAKYKGIVDQQEIPFEPEEDIVVKPISPPDFRFKIQFKSGGKEHDFSVFDWEVDALYYKLVKDGDTADDAAAKVIDKLKKELDLVKKDTHFFLGNIAHHPQVFTIVGLWYPKLATAKPQRKGLFDEVA